MTALAFDPLLGWAPVWAALAVAALAGAVAYWAGLRGWAFRALGAAALALALAGPAVERSTAHALDDIVIVLDDRTASQSLPGREAQTDAAIAALEDQIAALPGTALRRVTLDDAPEGSLLGRAITNAVRAEPDSRLAGVIAVTDGLAADPAAIPADLPAPLHVLLTGAPGEWDRRLIIDEAPAFGLIGQEVTIALRIEDSGAVPDHIAGRPVALQIALDGAPPREVIAVPGARYEVPLTLEQPGANVLMLSVEAGEGELTTLNNTAALSINAVRDRLRVLLVSGEPNPGARSWRNLLKSDPGVDLIHFTILRPMEKADGVPVEEMSLIPFPTHDLFIERIEDFDLIVFDRYRVRGILLPEYFAAIRRYVENGGAVLVSAGPEISTVESL
ncbi:MAG: hypothetical protein Q4F71_11355, partial [Paracoccus sp. (in: a-proteobacteria)]|nr:hypothetical protein [Paracoccus sp. (in: a-proteobacteria)]